MATALVIGATGAVGKEIVGELLSSPKWSSVVTITRRPIEGVGPEYQGTADMKKLKQVVIDMDKMETEAKDAYKGVSTVFCALGTTRGQAGSAAQFKKVDYEYVAVSARQAKEAGVKHYAICTAQGASSKVWASDLALFHPLLYTKCKGLSEDVVREQGFERVTIARPGLLERNDPSRSLERAFASVFRGLPVRKVAVGLIREAERASGPPLTILTNDALHKIQLPQVPGGISA